MVLKARRDKQEFAVVYAALHLLTILNDEKFCPESLRMLMRHGPKAAYKKCPEGWVRYLGTTLVENGYLDPPDVPDADAERDWEGNPINTSVLKRARRYYPYDVLLDGCYAVLEKASKAR